MQKFRDKLIYITGLILGFFFVNNKLFAFNPEYMLDYGVFIPEEPAELTLWEKIIKFMLSPFFFVVIAILIIIIGVFLFIKRKKHAKNKK